MNGGTRDLKEFKGYKIGMKVIITGVPSTWSSHCNENYPMRIKFPYYCTIKMIGYHNSSYSMTCGYYGWALDTLIDEHLILSEKEMRRRKIKKIEYGREI